MNKNKKNQQTINVWLDVAPLSNDNKDRGVGMYTRCLIDELEKIPNLTLEKKYHRSTTNIIHYPYFDLFFSTLPILKKTNTVVTIHDVIPLLFPEKYPVGIKGNLALHKQKLSLSAVKAVITDSWSSKKDISKFLGVNNNKIHVVHLAPNPDIKKFPANLIKKVIEKYNLPKNYVLYVGDINYNKNLPALIKAIKYLPEQISLVLVGKNFKQQDIPEWHWIATQMSMSNVADRITFIDSINNKSNLDLSAIYSGAICYVQPSFYEGFGLPVLEAMRALTPVVTGDNSSLKEVGSNKVLYTELDAENIAQAIQQVISWPDEKRAEVISQALAWSQTFSWQKTALETAEVYQKILS